RVDEAVVRGEELERGVHIRAVSIEDCPAGAAKDREVSAATVAVYEPSQPDERDRRHLKEDADLQGTPKATQGRTHDSILLPKRPWRTRRSRGWRLADGGLPDESGSTSMSP